MGYGKEKGKKGKKGKNKGQSKGKSKDDNSPSMGKPAPKSGLPQQNILGGKSASSSREVQGSAHSSEHDADDDMGVAGERVNSASGTGTFPSPHGAGSSQLNIHQVPEVTAPSDDPVDGHVLSRLLTQQAGNKPSAPGKNSESAHDAAPAAASLGSSSSAAAASGKGDDDGAADSAPRTRGGKRKPPMKRKAPGHTGSNKKAKKEITEESIFGPLRRGYSVKSLVGSGTDLALVYAYEGLKAEDENPIGLISARTWIEWESSSSQTDVQKEINSTIETISDAHEVLDNLCVCQLYPESTMTGTVNLKGYTFCEKATFNVLSGGACLRPRCGALHMGMGPGLRALRARLSQLVPDRVSRRIDPLGGMPNDVQDGHPGRIPTELNELWKEHRRTDLFVEFPPTKVPRFPIPVEDNIGQSADLARDLHSQVRHFEVHGTAEAKKGWGDQNKQQTMGMSLFAGALRPLFLFCKSVLEVKLQVYFFGVIPGVPVMGRQNWRELDRFYLLHQMLTLPQTIDVWMRNLEKDVQRHEQIQNENQEFSGYTMNHDYLGTETACTPADVLEAGKRILTALAGNLDFPIPEDLSEIEWADRKSGEKYEAHWQSVMETGAGSSSGSSASPGPTSSSTSMKQGAGTGSSSKLNVPSGPASSSTSTKQAQGTGRGRPRDRDSAGSKQQDDKRESRALKQDSQSQSGKVPETTRGRSRTKYDRRPDGSARKQEHEFLKTGLSAARDLMRSLSAPSQRKITANSSGDATNSSGQVKTPEPPKMRAGPGPNGRAGNRRTHFEPQSGTRIIPNASSTYAGDGSAWDMAAISPLSPAWSTFPGPSAPSGSFSKGKAAKEVRRNAAHQKGMALSQKGRGHVEPAGGKKGWKMPPVLTGANAQVLTASGIAETWPEPSSASGTQNASGGVRGRPPAKGDSAKNKGKPPSGNTSGTGKGPIAGKTGTSSSLPRAKDHGAGGKAPVTNKGKSASGSATSSNSHGAGSSRPVAKPSNPNQNGKGQAGIGRMTSSNSMGPRAVSDAGPGREDGKARSHSIAGSDTSEESWSPEDEEMEEEAQPSVTNDPQGLDWHREQQKNLEAMRAEAAVTDSDMNGEEPDYASEIEKIRSRMEETPIGEITAASALNHQRLAEAVWKRNRPGAFKKPQVGKSVTSTFLRSASRSMMAKFSPAQPGLYANKLVEKEGTKDSAGGVNKARKSVAQLTPANDAPTQEQNRALVLLENTFVRKINGDEFEMIALTPASVPKGIVGQEDQSLTFLRDSISDHQETYNETCGLFLHGPPQAGHQLPLCNTGVAVYRGGEEITTDAFWSRDPQVGRRYTNDFIAMISTTVMKEDAREVMATEPVDALVFRTWFHLVSGNPSEAVKVTLGAGVTGVDHTMQAAITGENDLQITPTSVGVEDATQATVSLRTEPVDQVTVHPTHMAESCNTPLPSTVFSEYGRHSLHAAMPSTWAQRQFLLGSMFLSFVDSEDTDGKSMTYPNKALPNKYVVLDPGQGVPSKWSNGQVSGVPNSSKTLGALTRSGKGYQSYGYESFSAVIHSTSIAASAAILGSGKIEGGQGRHGFAHGFPVSHLASAQWPFEPEEGADTGAKKKVAWNRKKMPALGAEYETRHNGLFGGIFGGRYQVGDPDKGTTQAWKEMGEEYRMSERQLVLMSTGTEKMSVSAALQVAEKPSIRGRCDVTEQPPSFVHRAHVNQPDKYSMELATGVVVLDTLDLVVSKGSAQHGSATSTSDTEGKVLKGNKASILDPEVFLKCYPFHSSGMSHQEGAMEPDSEKTVGQRYLHPMAQGCVVEVSYTVPASQRYNFNLRLQRKVPQNVPSSHGSENMLLRLLLSNLVHHDSSGEKLKRWRQVYPFVGTDPDVKKGPNNAVTLKPHLDQTMGSLQQVEVLLTSSKDTQMTMFAEWRVLLSRFSCGRITLAEDEETGIRFGAGALGVQNLRLLSNYLHKCVCVWAFTVVITDHEGGHTVCGAGALCTTLGLSLIDVLDRVLRCQREEHRVDVKWDLIRQAEGTDHGTRFSNTERRRISFIPLRMLLETETKNPEVIDQASTKPFAQMLPVPSKKVQLIVEKVRLNSDGYPVRNANRTEDLSSPQFTVTSRDSKAGVGDDRLQNQHLLGSREAVRKEDNLQSCSTVAVGHNMISLLKSVYDRGVRYLPSLNPGQQMVMDKTHDTIRAAKLRETVQLSANDPAIDNAMADQDRAGARHASGLTETAPIRGRGAEMQDPSMDYRASNASPPQVISKILLRNKALNFQMWRETNYVQFEEGRVLEVGAGFAVRMQLALDRKFLIGRWSASQHGFSTCLHHKSVHVNLCGDTRKAKDNVTILPGVDLHQRHRIKSYRFPRAERGRRQDHDPGRRAKSFTDLRTPGKLGFFTGPSVMENNDAAFGPNVRGDHFRRVKQPYKITYDIENTIVGEVYPELMTNIQQLDVMTTKPSLILENVFQSYERLHQAVESEEEIRLRPATGVHAEYTGRVHGHHVETFLNGDMVLGYEYGLPVTLQQCLPLYQDVGGWTPPSGAACIPPAVLPSSRWTPFTRTVGEGIQAPPARALRHNTHPGLLAFNTTHGVTARSPTSENLPPMHVYVKHIGSTVNLLSLGRNDMMQYLVEQLGIDCVMEPRTKCQWLRMRMVPAAGACNSTCSGCVQCAGTAQDIVLASTGKAFPADITACSEAQVFALENLTHPSADNLVNILLEDTTSSTSDDVSMSSQ